MPGNEKGFMDLLSGLGPIASKIGLKTIAGALGAAARDIKCLEIVARSIAEAEGTPWPPADQAQRALWTQRATNAIHGLREYVLGGKG